MQTKDSSLITVGNESSFRLLGNEFGIAEVSGFDEREGADVCAIVERALDLEDSVSEQNGVCEASARDFSIIVVLAPVAWLSRERKRGKELSPSAEFVRKLPERPR
jgi:hypothetical protein